MVSSSLIIAGIIVVLVVLSLIALMSRYRRCASDEILVVFGKAGKKTVTNPTTGKSETVYLPSKIIHGGGTFVFPIIQDWRKMSLKPIQIQTTVVGVSSQMIKVTIPVTLTTGIGTTDELMQNAASRFLTTSTDEISDQIRDILIGGVRSLMATMTIEEINADRVKFLGSAKETIEIELNKVGFSIININNADIDDASAKMFEHIHLGQVTVYGNENTAGNFMAKTAENLNPALELLRSVPFADTVKSMFTGKQIESKPEQAENEENHFEEVK